MSGRMLETLIRGYMATTQPHYVFGWQGGEPTLMGLDFFKQVVDLQKKHGRPGSAVANGLQTNATLITEAFAEHLAEYKFLLGVSLDGPEDVHDRYRRNAAGMGSHSGVMKGIHRLRRAKVEFNILTLVSQSNANHAKTVYRYLVDNDFLYHQYIPCVEFDAAGTVLPFGVSGEQWGRFLCVIFDSWIQADTRRVSIRLFDSILSCLVDGHKTICHMENDCRQYFVVEHNGDIYPCDFFVEENLQIGNIADTSWDSALASDVYRQFGVRKRARNKACESCEFVNLCAGDCQKHRPHRDDTSDNLSVLCAGWKLFFRHTLAEFMNIAKRIVAEREQMAVVSGDRRREPGRNDPCPCGSGLKFKKCCLKKVRGGNA